MSERTQKALENHRKGYNCAQAVVCAYCDIFGVSEREGFKMSEALGFGMGSMGTCGAVSAMAVLAGMKISDGALEAPGTKKESYKAMREMTERFIEKNGSVICRELKGVDTGNVIRSCDGCVEDAATVVEMVLQK